MERLFRHATSLPLHNYKAKTDARLTMQKMNPSTAVILFCARAHGRGRSILTAFSPGISHRCLTPSSRQNSVWTVADRMGRAPLATRQKHPSTPGIRPAEVALSSLFNSTRHPSLFWSCPTWGISLPPQQYLEYGRGHEGTETLMMSSLCNSSKHNLHFKSSDVLLMKRAAN